MKNFLLCLFLIILAGEIVTLFLMRKEKPREKVLSVATASISLTASPTAQPTITPSPTPLPTPKPIPVKTATSVPQPTFTSQQINGFIDKFAGQYGVDPNVIRSIALCESGFNPSAKNYIYRGLFQFGPVTWQNIRVKMNENNNINLRLNAEDAVQTAAYAISTGDKAIWPHCYP